VLGESLPPGEIASPAVARASKPSAVREASEMPPPDLAAVHLRSRTEAHTGYFDYALRDGKIWTRTWWRSRRRATSSAAESWQEYQADPVLIEYHAIDPPFFESDPHVDIRRRASSPALPKVPVRRPPFTPC